MISYPNACPCCSGKSYEECCRSYHEKQAFAPTAELLMRSRYSAYILRLPDYLIETTHPMSPHYHPNLWWWRRQLMQSCRDFRGVQLQILEAREEDDQGAVLFVITSQDGEQESQFYELSRFERVLDRWKYKWGHLRDGLPSPHDHIDRVNLLSLAYYEAPVLRKQAAPITSITSEIKELADRMIATMEACDALGLAAPQVHQSLQLFVMRAPIHSSDSFSLGPVQVLINPYLSEPSQETWKTGEGCLSIPGLQEEVIRPQDITVEYMDLEGRWHRRRVSGWEARVMCHEYDHLRGVLYIDMLPKRKQEKIADFLQSLHQRWEGRSNS